MLLCVTQPSLHGQAVAQTLTGASHNYLLHADPNYGITIEYPEDWQKTERGTLNIFNINNSIAIAEFHPPDRSVSFVIIVERLVENRTLKQYLEGNIAALREGQPDIAIIEQNRTTTLAGTPGYKLVAKGSLDFERTMEGLGLGQAIRQVIGQMIEFQPVTMTSMMFITVHGNDGYVIGYSDASGEVLNQLCTAFGDLIPECTSTSNIEDAYSYYLPIAEKMIGSFAVTIQNQTNGIEPQRQLINDTQPTNENPCSIIDIRLATGQIAIEEYERLRQILQC
jgi:hypothetical protein